MVTDGQKDYLNVARTTINIVRRVPAQRRDEIEKLVGKTWQRKAKNRES